MAAVFSIVTAFFWGTYGPILHKGSYYMESYVPKDPENPKLARPLGRMRPFLCVGLAYFVIAIVAPAVMVQVFGVERGNGIASGWTFSGITWSFAGGAVGALGAFALIMALNNGPPARVMPIVFGIAPLISVGFGMYLNKTLDKISPFFFVGMILLIFGAITVLATAPGPGSHGKTKDKHAKDEKALEKKQLDANAGEDPLTAKDGK
jgi:hypothetical protein